jgi:hypothetical protein
MKVTRDADDERDAETAMERFDDFARTVFSKTKDDLRKAEERERADRC